MKLVFLAGHEFLSNQLVGGRQGSFKNYQLLSWIYGEENIYVVTFSNIDISQKAKNVMAFPKHRNRVEQYYNCLFLRNGYSKSTEKKLIKYIATLQPDIIFFDSTFTGNLLTKIKKYYKNSMQIIAYLHNVEKNHVWDKVIHENILYFFPYLSYYKNEKALLQRADYIMGLNMRDAIEVDRIYHRKMDYILPVSYIDVFEEQKITQPEDRITLLFVGAFFGPNNQGIQWFIETVLPYCDNSVNLIIIGKDMEKLQRQLEGERVTVVGTVLSTATYYYRADVVVLPILYGNGMKTKTAEAMMYGKYILGTKEAFEGYDIEAIDEMVVCANAVDFIREINAYTKNEKRSRFYDSVRNRFLEKYEHNAVKNDFKQFMKNIYNKAQE